MIYQPPPGARDLLPLEVAQTRWIEAHLREVFRGWGYQQIITSTFERLDTLMAGGAVQPSTVIQLQTTDEGEIQGLRPELTASIARMAVTRFKTATLPLRLFYQANVFRRVAKTSQQEFRQAGVELLGATGLMADGEILLLLLDCLGHLQLPGGHLLLGEAGLTRSLLSPFPEPLRQRVRQAIAQLDRIGLEALPLSEALRARALSLMDLRGQPESVLQQVSQLELTAEQRDRVSNLKGLVDLLRQGAWTIPKGNTAAATRSGMALILDLSLIQPFDYYTGIIFEVISDTASGQRVLGQGGRYDQLMSLYHPEGESIPGIGFSLNTDTLHQVLLQQSGPLPQQLPSPSWLVVAQTAAAAPAAFAYAQTLRAGAAGLAVEMALAAAGEAAAEIRRYARDRQVDRIAWVDATGAATIETIGTEAGVTSTINSLPT
ncbi:ATP phosphoribosyltransferase regulatory subunit [Trichothermofontia sichuanensis B231]|uniref:ATP phosphoribosyltransferase regulatory subunit n=1 Tax=Trichothermofontia sichuanensis TaxID=3045816 RepID=UPI0022483F85|nr:ATP phosphoribosyltransferase regulatory subunit [Trichothermofontia sichuanensis]UZQ55560.1 ATP phosphoribosyltransferase regulatory subunit [Trichothermofontia sichuanensis B231]